MKKPRLLGLGNNGMRNYFILSKDKSFIPLFSNFLLNCGFRSNQYVDGEIEKLFTDTIQHFKNKDYDIDVVHGKNSILLIIRASQDLRESINKGVRNMCYKNGERKNN